LCVKRLGSGVFFCSTAAHFSAAFDTLHFTVVTTSYLGAIFVMVRGFDNIQSCWHGVHLGGLGDG